MLGNQLFAIEGAFRFRSVVVIGWFQVSPEMEGESFCFWCPIEAMRDFMLYWLKKSESARRTPILDMQWASSVDFLSFFLDILEF